MKIGPGVRVGVVVPLLLLFGAACSDAPTAHPDAPNEKQESAELWTCSMHPHLHMDEPGRCPICGMDLIPVTDEPTTSRDRERPVLELSPDAVELAEIRTLPATRGAAVAELRLDGKIELDETRVREISAWVPGRLERLYVDFTGIEVKKGDPLVEIYSPELISAQEELLQALRTERSLRGSDLASVRDSGATMLEATRRKLRLLGLTPEQVAAIERRGSVQDHVVMHSPLDGVVIHKAGREGQYVETGTHIYAVADLSHVWARLDAYESDLTWIRLDQDVSFTTDAVPGKTFHGRVAFVDPVLDPRTRTAKVRVDVENPEGRLKPQAFVRAILKANLDPTDREFPLLIPATAPLVTGRRAVVYVRLPDREVPTFEGREVVLGPRSGLFYVVQSGLSEGERVVVNGAFKIDSALQIQAKPSMMLPEGGTSGGAHDHGSGEAPH
jgi:Cu(I)/Ag(I) efflux system membrane fusion protein